MYERSRVNVKVARVLTLTLTRDLPYNASILITREKFTCVRTKITTVEIHLKDKCSHEYIFHRVASVAVTQQSTYASENFMSRSK